METKEIALSRIAENENNPRTITTEKFKKLVKSLLVFPRMLTLRPIVVDDTFKVLGGNMRLKALRHITTMDADVMRSTIEENDKLSELEVANLVSYWTDWRKKPTATIVSAADLTEAQKREFIIKDNVGFGDWDTDMLANQWDTDALKDWGIEDWQLGMSADSLKNDGGDNGETAEEDDFDQDSEEIQERCKRGDVWLLGRHRLMCGDSVNAEDVEKLMDGAKANMVFADPPYGAHKNIVNDNLNADELLIFNSRWIPISFAELASNGSWYCWGLEEPLFLTYANILRPMIDERKITYRNLITWDKGSTMTMNSDGATMYAPAGQEKCLFVMKGMANVSSGCFRTKEYFYEGFATIRDYLCAELQKSGLTKREVVALTSSYATHYFATSQWAFPTEKDYKILQEYCRGAAFQKEYAAFQKEYAEIQKEYAEIQKEYAATLPYFNNTHEIMSDVWQFNRTKQTEREDAGGHETPKPVVLCTRAIKTSSREGELVLDLFGGSGTTLIAAEQLNRTAYLMEIDPHYCDVIIRRWEKLTGDEAKKAE